MRIDKIRELATKYSKPDLQRMVQMGMVNPQEAVMAGMMIDRIAKSAMQPPQTTVAQDVLSPQPAQMPPMAQGQPPQMPPQMPRPAMAADGGLMGMMPHSYGVAALNSGLHDMAGGGIVAFAEGGETDDVPGFADRGYVDSDMFKSVIAAESRGNPNAVSPKGARGLAQLMPGTARDPGFGVEGARDSSSKENVRVGNEYLNAMLKKYGNIDYALAAYNWGPGNVDKWIARGAKPEELPKETREYIPKVKAGMEQMQAKTPMPGKDMFSGLTDLLPSASARESYIQDPMQERGDKGTRQVPPMIAGPQSPTPGTEQPRVAPTGKFGAFNVPEDQFPLQGHQELLDRGQEAMPKPSVSTFEPVTEEEKIKPPADIKAEQIKVPEETSFGKEYADMQSAYKQAGVDTDMYKNMMSELDTKKAGFAQKKEQALGAAMLAFGLDLAGARKGQVFQQMSGGGQKALGMYMNSMEKIAENEDKLDNLKSQLRMAENNYKRTGADSALAQVRARKERIDQIEAKNAEMRQRAAEHQATVGASVFHTRVMADVSRENALTTAGARMAAAKATAGRAGALTQKQQYDIEQQLRTELGPKIRKLYEGKGSDKWVDEQTEKELKTQVENKLKEIMSRPGGYGGNPPQDLFADYEVKELSGM
jgi:hypothetical protein